MNYKQDSQAFILICVKQENSQNLGSLILDKIVEQDFGSFLGSGGFNRQRI